MRLFGFEITKASPTPTQPLSGDRGYWWTPIIREPFTGAWQRNMELRSESVLTYHAVYSCITLIASDVAKCRLKLVEQGTDAIWEEVDVAAFTPVLRKPNHYQTRIQFIESWVTSKLITGNTYVLKGRDNRNVVTALYVLDPQRCKPLVTPSGDIYYRLSVDNLSGIEADMTVPASEIIHDMSTLRYHPLCGVPPMACAALAAAHGLKIQTASSKFFENGARPSGIVSTPNTLTGEQAEELKQRWQDGFSGDNAGRVAILGDGLQYTPMAATAVESQQVEQLGISAKMVCSSFNVPAYKVGVGDPPAYNNIEALNQAYYTDCLQKYYESIEILLDEGLGLTKVPDHEYGTEFDLDDLLRMDTATLVRTEAEAVKGGIKSPNEARARLNLPPVKGGGSVFLQQQNFSLEALAKRDALDDPFASKTPAASSETSADDEATNDNTPEKIDAAAALLAWELKSLLSAPAA